MQTEPPKQIESYIHRCGRTGRVNRDGVAVTLCDRSNEGLIYRIESTSKIRMEKLNIKDLGEDLSTTAVDPMGIRIGLNFPKPSRETEPPPRRKYCEI